MPFLAVRQILLVLTWHRILQNYTERGMEIVADVIDLTGFNPGWRFATLLFPVLEIIILTNQSADSMV